MSLKRLPSRTSDPTPKYYPSRRSQSEKGHMPYERHTAPSPPPSSHNAYTPPPPYRRPSPNPNFDIIEASPDPDEPEVYRTHPEMENRRVQSFTADSPTPRPSAKPRVGSNEQPSSASAAAQNAPPEDAQNHTPDWLKIGREKGFNIFHLFGLGVALDSNQGLHVRVYVNLRLLFGLLVAAPVFSFVDLGDIERWRQAFDVIAQLLS